MRAADYFKMAALERGHDIFLVMRRIGQIGRVDVGAIADHQRQARFRECRIAAQDEGKRKQQPGFLKWVHIEISWSELRLSNEFGNLHMANVTVTAAARQSGSID